MMYALILIGLVLLLVAMFDAVGNLAAYGDRG